MVSCTLPCEDNSEAMNVYVHQLLSKREEEEKEEHAWQLHDGRE